MMSNHVADSAKDIAPTAAADAVRTVVVLQPAYLPWMGFFDQLVRSSVFVYYDDVQYDKHGWRNRNRIKAANGEPHWLTIPVRRSGLDWPLIKDVEIDKTNAWSKKHVGTIRQFYKKAPFLKTYIDELEELLMRPWVRLVDLDIATVELLRKWFNIERPIHRSSELGITGDKSERLLNICKHFDAKRYVSGDAAKDYLNVELFRSHGVDVEWQSYTHPVYPQLHGDFTPYLSALDLVLNCGPESATYLARPTAQKEMS